jgi:hypothetical protein
LVEHRQPQAKRIAKFATVLQHRLKVAGLLATTKQQGGPPAALVISADLELIPQHFAGGGIKLASHQ